MDNWMILLMVTAAVATYCQGLRLPGWNY